MGNFSHVAHISAVHGFWLYTTVLIHTSKQYTPCISLWRFEESACIALGHDKKAGLADLFHQVSHQCFLSHLS